MTVFASLVSVFVTIISGFFGVFDTYIVFDTGYSLLDYMVAISFFGITLWFIMRVLGSKKDGNNTEGE